MADDPTSSLSNILFEAVFCVHETEELEDEEAAAASEKEAATAEVEAAGIEG